MTGAPPVLGRCDGIRAPSLPAETKNVPDAPHAVHFVSREKFNALVLLDRNIAPPYNKVRNNY